MSNTLKILSRPHGSAEEYGRWSVNPYTGCQNRCTYCYLKKGVWKNILGGDTPRLKKGLTDKEKAFTLAMEEIQKNREQIVSDGGVFMSFITDPCAKETRGLFFRIAKECVSTKHNVPVTMLTKCTDFLPYTAGKMDVLEEVRLTAAWSRTIGSMTANINRDILAIGFSLTGHDELEPNAAPNAERIKAIRYLHCNGYHTWVSIEPVISFTSSLDMVYQALNAGCEHFKIGLLTSNTRVCRDRYNLRDCLHFVDDVMRMTNDKATVYWKKSVRELMGAEYECQLEDYPNSVGKDNSLFT